MSPRSHRSHANSHIIAQQLQRSSHPAWPQGEQRQSARCFQNFAAGIDQLEVDRGSRFTRLVLDASLIGLGWALFVGLVAYPQAQLVGMLGCGVAMLFTRK